MWAGPLDRGRESLIFSGGMPPKRIFAAAVILAAVACSCGGKRDFSNMSAELMYLQASRLAAEDKGVFSRNSKEEPLEILKELQIRHAFSPYASLAALKTADIYFDSGKYETAADQYRQFVSNNPGHAEREHAMYRLSESFYRTRESPKRDQSPCKRAIYWFQSFLSYHPESERADEARTKISVCVNLIAESEVETGKFYLRRKRYEAARRRFAYVEDNFPNTEAAIWSRKLMASIPPKEEEEENGE